MTEAQQQVIRRNVISGRDRIVFFFFFASHGTGSSSLLFQERNGGSGLVYTQKKKPRDATKVPSRTDKDLRVVPACSKTRSRSIMFTEGIKSGQPAVARNDGPHHLFFRCRDQVKSLFHLNTLAAVPLDPLREKAFHFFSSRVVQLDVASSAISI